MRPRNATCGWTRRCWKRRSTPRPGSPVSSGSTQMVDLTPDEIPMPQERLDLLPGCSGKTYSD